MDANLAELKRRFLENEVGTLTINGALATRDDTVRIYRPHLNDTHKKRINKAIRSKLSALQAGYMNRIYSEDDHVQNIENLAAQLTAEFSSDLWENRFRIGISQKLLNLYLKYQWTLERIPEPWHCPFDSNIIGRLDTIPKPNWKCLDAIVDYKGLVANAKRVALKHDLSLAMWELREWRGTLQ